MKKEVIKTEIIVKSSSIRVMRVGKIYYISITDLAKFKDSERFDYIIQNWLRSKHTLEYVGTWELLYNPNFNSIEFDGFNFVTYERKNSTKKYRPLRRIFINSFLIYNIFHLYLLKLILLKSLLTL